jgi:GT2 family glycosyltransferase
MRKLLENNAMDKRPLLSVVVLNYNGGDLLQRTLESLFASTTGLSMETFVVDNGSHDGSPDTVHERFPQVRVIETGANLGFARGNNRALAQVQGHYVLLLNPDVVVHPGAIPAVLEYMEFHPEAGIVGPRVLLPDGRLDKPCRRSFKTPAIYLYKTIGLSALFPKSPRFNRYYMGYLPDDQLTEVDAVIGAFLMIRRACLDQIGLLDERFFIYCEDEDWCFQARKASWKVVYNPQAVVTHYKGSSTSQRPLRMIYEWHKAIWQFHQKNLAPGYCFLVNGLVYLGIGVRLAIAFVAATVRWVLPRKGDYGGNKP